MNAPARAGPSLDSPPLVLRRRRRDEVQFAVAGAMASIAALVFAATSLRFVALPLGLIALITLALGILQLARPTILVLSPEGLRYRILGIDRRWTWDTVSGFHAVRVGSGKAVAFDLRREDRATSFGIPAFFQLSASQLADLLNDAQRRWGGATR